MDSSTILGIGAMIVLALARDLFGSRGDHVAGRDAQRGEVGTGRADADWLHSDASRFADDHVDVTPISAFADDHTWSMLEPFWVNPATGLPMIGGICGMDVGGNPFGMDVHADMFADSGCGGHVDDFHSTSCSFDLFD